MKIWQCNGYFKDDNSNFNDCIIVESDSTPKGYTDEDIFFYGASVLDMYDGNFEDFVVTERKLLKQ